MSWKRHLIESIQIATFSGYTDNSVYTNLTFFWSISLHSLLLHEPSFFVVFFLENKNPISWICWKNNIILSKQFSLQHFPFAVSLSLSYFAFYMWLWPSFVTLHFTFREKPLSLILYDSTLFEFFLPRWIITFNMQLHFYWKILHLATNTYNYVWHYFYFYQTLFLPQWRNCACFFELWHYASYFIHWQTLLSYFYQDIVILPLTYIFACIFFQELILN